MKLCAMHVASAFSLDRYYRILFACGQPAGEKQCCQLRGRRCVLKLQKPISLRCNLLCALKINVNGSIEIRPCDSPLLVTNCAHAAFPPSDEFAT